MKNLIIISISSVISILSFGQESNVELISISENGIKVYTSSGIEGVRSKSISIVQQENLQVPVSDYNQVQCESAISDIKSKIIAVEGEIDALKQIDSYRKKLILLENRINEINNESHGK